MREILFRGKCVEVGIYHKRWLEGFYGEDNGKALIARNTDIGMVGYFCDSDTVGQYTGLKDKNGTRIFEGDILKFYGEDGDEESYTKDEAIWLENGWHAQDVHRLYMADTLSPPSWVKEHFEVIGNIYDNPELLKGDNNDKQKS